MSDVEKQFVGIKISQQSLEMLGKLFPDSTTLDERVERGIEKLAQTYGRKMRIKETRAAVVLRHAIMIHPSLPASNYVKITGFSEPHVRKTLTYLRKNLFIVESALQPAWRPGPRAVTYELTEIGRIHDAAYEFKSEAPDWVYVKAGGSSNYIWECYE
jgi:hypothetical protein